MGSQTGPISDFRTDLVATDGVTTIRKIREIDLTNITLTDQGNGRVNFNAAAGGANTWTDVNISTWNGNIAALVVDVTDSKVKALKRSRILDILFALEVDSVVAGQVINLANMINFVVGELSLTRDNSQFAVSGIGASAGQIITEPVGWVDAQDVTAGLNGTSTSLSGVVMTRSSVGVYQDIFTMRSTFDASQSGDRRWGTSANLPFVWVGGDWITGRISIPITS